MAQKKRIDYIDYLKGLTILWVVWYHTSHPEFVDYPPTMPMFFFLSGIFFKPYPLLEFIKKKINTLLIPFAFFYVVYYIYLILQWSIHNPLSSFDFSCFWGIFRLYKSTESFPVNPPLWFICALINQQFLIYFLVKANLKRVAIGISALLISLFGVFYFYDVKAPFMISRCMPYFIFYSMGYLTGRHILSLIDVEHGIKTSRQLGLCGLTVFILCWFIKSAYNLNHFLGALVSYAEIFAFILLMIYLLKYSYKLPFLRFLHFYGVNSYIVLGMHEIILTIYLICYTNLFGQPGVSGGIIILILTTSTLWPVIQILNKLCPQLIGKNELWK
ncbi:MULTISPECIES: acyltransferase family protein [Duncaniella]|jgi:fucose 4-O-acetylase-like acetyltransferase|uniref:Acyltransferase n=6 Tax=Muribaculaceae TaxID=2005473 RepID=A0A2V1IQC8_9BACT|nr:MULTISPECIES: acyltransferase [Duncaniella]NBH91761.1 acyltransferase [Muribaculaceae bacterium S4]NBI20173.1 acyltransferase [Muribaculaceae bacterium Z1]ROS88953.1 acyltransferase [Muribaculaceae bacterium Isolate-039 (Harlan)]ROS97995.1 acyltransferase [Muribaculaceae bacterium Isolate-083 (Janvier)]ROS99106.1 acyltransferase [Muribaculaceae bacterium Isolate-077 (Janvier)]ROT01846.1 acyltransferase [Muribaculaceae bacterium Isolate-084 (Janvier)]